MCDQVEDAAADFLCHGVVRGERRLDRVHVYEQDLQPGVGAEAAQIGS
ncbi:hypothetical protein ALQ26_200035 [Pseudomonas amygdali pv. lachrymans]|nr:hypothetical protein ALQ26_200035 [Pseudomonas amygdali pv. lachrymans]